MLSAGEVFWWNAFCDLDFERVQMAVPAPRGGVMHVPGPIPPKAIREYADRFGVPYHHLRYIIDAMDSALRDKPNG